MASVVVVGVWDRQGALSACCTMWTAAFVHASSEKEVRDGAVQLPQHPSQCAHWLVSYQPNVQVHEVSVARPHALSRKPQQATKVLFSVRSCTAQGTLEANPSLPCGNHVMAVSWMVCESLHVCCVP